MRFTFVMHEDHMLISSAAVAQVLSLRRLAFSSTFLMQVIPMDSMGFQEACNIRVDELQVLSMEFLYDCPRPTVALLYHDNKDVRHLRTYEISLKDKVHYLST